MRQENKEWWYSAHVRPSDDDVREAVRLYEDEGWTLKEIGKKFDRSSSTIHRWITKFAKDLDSQDMSKNKLRATRQMERAKRRYGVTAPEEIPAVGDKSESESLEEKVKRLEEELRKAKLARDFYDEMINVAEKQFNINIRKKAGTRQ